MDVGATRGTARRLQLREVTVLTHGHQERETDPVEQRSTDIPRKRVEEVQRVRHSEESGKTGFIVGIEMGKQRKTGIGPTVSNDGLW